jgi:putative membrane protein
MRITTIVLALCVTTLPAIAADNSAKQRAIDFATKAAISNAFEVEAAKIEIAKGRANDAKQFAQDMVKDHGKAGTILRDAAAQDGVALPDALDDEHKQKLAAFEQSDPSNLDQAYLSTQLTAHQQAVKLFDAYSKRGPDGQLKRSAEKLLPDLRMHLTRVQALTSK